MTTLTLAGLAVLLAGPVPALMTRWPTLRRTPGAAVLLWQSVALAAILAALGAGLSLTVEHAGPEPGSGWVQVVAVAALVLTVVVAGRLLLSGHRVGTELRAIRRRHRHQLDLVARRDDALHRGIEVLDHEVPLAYCVPGLTGSRVVVSTGALGRLSTAEVDAVLAHERAHLSARHDLVLEAFSVLHRAFPRWVSSRTALAEVRLLVEILADRAAVGANDPRPLARALVTLAEGRAPEAALGAAMEDGLGGGGAGLVARVDLLADPRPHRLQAALLVAASVAVLVLPTALVVLPWLRTLP